MEQAEIKQHAQQLSERAARFWAGEAEIVRTFFSKPRAKEEHIKWLRLQCYKGLYGSGLVSFSEGLIPGFIDHLHKRFPMVDIEVDRHEFEHLIEVLYQEFKHYRLTADILDGLTGERSNPQEHRKYQYPEDLKLQEIRDHFRQTEGELGESAISFTEGGRAALFYEGMKLKGDPLLDQVAKAFSEIFDDEVEHQESGAEDLERVAKTEEAWEKAGHMVQQICQQRLRMRNEQFGFPISDERLREIIDGKIAPIYITATG